ncbi:toxin MazF [Variovorax sp. WS11]|uniref:endoribonuclease MazF n=1 Tax=Variovorax sp. WS11 TaxID=1105204 RepID=UPI000D0D50E0|nr:endoribonuclease MazF [Variovorax sp. WS11]NDZ17040.1 endoribonuclease MazF [Variovorax sp. WS11]PSL78975.1 toxin MazF [Variovorax sp. WS11]
MIRRYVPEAGDIVWLHFDPQAGHEQAGHRPALVLSPSAYNAKTGLMLCCPLTTQVKGYPFEVEIAGARTGAALADQVKSLDWVVRKASRKGKASAAELAEVRAKAIALTGKP